MNYRSTWPPCALCGQPRGALHVCAGVDVPTFTAAAALPPLVDRIAERIEDDVTDRRGWRQEWEQFDEETQAEIRATWRRIIAEEVAR